MDMSFSSNLKSSESNGFTFPIVNGPTRHEIFDMCKYVFTPGFHAFADFSIPYRKSEGDRSYLLSLHRLKILGVEMISQTDMILRGSCYADLYGCDGDKEHLYNFIARYGIRSTDNRGSITFFRVEDPVEISKTELDKEVWEFSSDYPLN